VHSLRYPKRKPSQGAYLEKALGKHVNESSHIWNIPEKHEKMRVGTNEVFRGVPSSGGISLHGLSLLLIIIAFSPCVRVMELIILKHSWLYRYKWRRVRFRFLEPYQVHFQEYKLRTWGTWDRILISNLAFFVLFVVLWVQNKLCDHWILDRTVYPYKQKTATSRSTLLKGCMESWVGKKSLGKVKVSVFSGS